MAYTSFLRKTAALYRMTQRHTERHTDRQTTDRQHTIGATDRQRNQLMDRSVKMKGHPVGRQWSVVMPRVNLNVGISINQSKWYRGNQYLLNITCILWKSVSFHLSWLFSERGSKKRIRLKSNYMRSWRHMKIIKRKNIALSSNVT